MKCDRGNQMTETNIGRAHEFATKIRKVAEEMDVTLWELKFALLEVDLDVTKLLMKENDWKRNN